MKEKKIRALLRWSDCAISMILADYKLYLVIRNAHQNHNNKRSKFFDALMKTSGLFAEKTLIYGGLDEVIRRCSLKSA